MIRRNYRARIQKETGFYLDGIDGLAISRVSLVIASSAITVTLHIKRGNPTLTLTAGQQADIDNIVIDCTPLFFEDANITVSYTYI